MKTFTHKPVIISDLASEISEKENASGGRYYKTPTGSSYPSVTTVLSEYSKEGIKEWRKRIGEEAANKIMRQSSIRGSKFHSMAEDFLNNSFSFDNYGLLETELFKVAIPELEKIDNIRAQEVPLFSHHLRMAGRVDCVAEYQGKLSIIDFKTARAEKSRDHILNYFMQATAYAIMFEERTKIPVSNLVLIIAVEDGFAQIMNGKRDDYVKDLLKYRDLYEENNK